MEVQGLRDGVAVPAPRAAADAAVDVDGFFDLVLDLVCLCGLDGRFRRVNGAWTPALGYDAHELTSRPFMDFVHPDDVEQTAAAVVELAQGRPVVLFRNRYRHRDGRYRILEWNCSLGGGDVIYGVARDVTEQVRRSQGQQALQEAWLELSAANDTQDAVEAVRRHAQALFGEEPDDVAVDAADHLAALVGGDPPAPRAGAGTGARRLARDELGEDDDEITHELLVAFTRMASVTLERVAAEARVVTALERTERLLDSITDAYFHLDEQWRFRHVNQEAERVLRRPASALLGRSLWEEFPEALDTEFERHYRRSLAQEQPVHFEAFYPPLDTWFEVRAYPSRDGLSVYFLDANERHAEAERLRRRSAQQEAVAALGQAATSGVDPASLLERAVRDAAALLEADVASVVQLGDVPSAPVTAGSGLLPARPSSGGALARALHGDAPVVVDATGPGVWTALPIGRPGAWWGAFEVFHGAGRSEPSTSDLLYLQQVVNVLWAAIERHDSEQRVRHQATHDALTRLPNRSSLQAALEQALAVRTVRPLALLLLDLDGFKDVNDSLGHAAGDEVLVEVAGRLRSAVPGHLLARLGGDEFAVLVAGADVEERIAETAAALVDAFAAPFSVCGLDIPLSASIGVAATPDDGADASTLLSHADVAMYRAKAHGATWCRYDPTVDAAQEERLSLVADLRRAIESGDIALHYQPIVDMRTGRAVSVEALARWRHRGRDLDVRPAEFIPLAEQVGLITPLTLHVLETARRDAVVLLAGNPDLRIAVNLSVFSLRTRAAAQPVVDAVIAARDVLSVEVTESSLADDTTQWAVRQLAEAGVRCSIDDFGTGYSSLAALRRLPVATVKIDRAFVRDIGDSDVDLSIVRSVAQLGQALTVSVVAEGVETASAAQRLLDAGVVLAQGYLYARPAPPAQLHAWLAQQPAS